MKSGQSLFVKFAILLRQDRKPKTRVFYKYGNRQTNPCRLRGNFGALRKVKAVNLK